MTLAATATLGVFDQFAETFEPLLMPKNILLLTATINPLKGIPSLARTDPVLRLGDYSRSIGFYLGLLGKCFDGIVFVENSAYDLSPLKEQVKAAGAADRVEFISFYGLDYPPSYGRGYGEFKLVDHGRAHSQFLRQDDDQITWKCTGRYLIRNLDKIVLRQPKSFDIYCHMRNYQYRLCDLFLLAWNNKGYEAAIRGVYAKLRNDVSAGQHTIEETLFRKVIEGLPGDVRVVNRFQQVPLVDGIRGWDNTSYSSRPWHLKILIRQFARTFLPWLWI